MKTKFIRRPGIVLLSILLPLAPLRAEEPALRDLLRDALFTEEVTRDPAKAAEQYQQLLARHDEQRTYAATALFRLAEVRRKQGRNEEAIALYQRLIGEFPEAAAEAKLAKENLAALGAEIPLAGTGPGREEAAELRRLEDLAESSPDRLRDPELLKELAGKGWSAAVQFVLRHGADPEKSGALSAAAGNGHLDVCRVLLAHGKPSPEEAGEALAEAIRQDRITVLTFLLESGLDPDSPVAFPKGSVARPLHIAAHGNKREEAELLIARGADTDALAKSHFVIPTVEIPAGTPLHHAIFRKAGDVFDLLLAADANSNIEIPLSLIRPLHLSAKGDTDLSLAMTEKLLKHRADPNTKTADISGHWLSGMTPLRAALHQPRKVELLLKHGADPDPEFPSAVGNGNLEIVRLLLEAGADPDPDLPDTSTIQLAAAGRGGRPIVELLISKGAEPDQEWIKNSYNFPDQPSLPDPSVLPLLYRNFLIPRLAEEPAVNLITSDFQGVLPLELAKQSDLDSPPPSLERLLLANRSHRWPFIKISEELHFPRQINIWRKNENGTLANIALALENSEPFPELKWGDVIELTIKENTSRNYNIEFRDGLPTDIVWHLHKRVSFPVTVEINDKIRTVEMRGNRLLFDPIKDEVPLIGAGRLIELLWQPLHPHPSRDEIEVVIAREGWQDIRLRYGDEATHKFPLESGDVIRLEVPAALSEGAEERRRRRVALTVRGIPFTRHFGVFGDISGPIQEPSVPTLFQALTAALASPQSRKHHRNLALKGQGADSLGASSQGPGSWNSQERTPPHLRALLPPRRRTAPRNPRHRHRPELG